MHRFHSTLHPRRRLGGFLALAVFALGCTSPSPSRAGRAAAEGTRAYRFERDAMGTRFRIVMFSDGTEADVRAAAHAALERVAELEQVASDWRADSELAQIAEKLDLSPRAKLSVSVTVSTELAQLFQICSEMRERSNGRFDPALGWASKLWRRAERQGEEPSISEIEALRERGKIAWTIQGTQLTLKDSILGRAPRFDMGAVAKGAALDQALGELQARGITMALVEGGGDVVCGTAPPGMGGWQIEMAPGSAFGETQPEVLLLENAAVATSGSHARGGVVEDVFRSHLVDGETYEALGGDGHRVASCVVVSREEFPDAGARADALATVLCLVPDGRRLELLLESPDFSARTWGKSFLGETLRQESPAFEAFVVMSSPSRNPSSF